MSRIRFSEGKIIKTTKGEHNIYSDGNITYTSSGSTISHVGVENGVTFDEPKKAPQPEIKERKIKFRPNQITSFSNIISVVENIENILKEGDVINIAGKEIKDNWISVGGKLYLIPEKITLSGIVFFNVNENMYQSTNQISNCVSAQDYIDSINEQIEILKEFIDDIELSDFKYKNHIKDRLSYDAYFRYIKCIQEIEVLFSESPEYDNVKKWINEKLTE